jgi:peptide/nickel transport system substrate-binding protein
MTKKIVWMVVGGLMALSLVMAACGPAAPVETTEEGEKKVISQPDEEKEQPKETEVVAEEVVEDMGPKYGGKLILVEKGDITRYSPIAHTVASAIISPINEELWGGDWTKGPVGTNDTDWGGNYNLWHLNQGVLAESTTWTVDEANAQGTIVYQVRQGVHYALNPQFEASRLLGGRQFTADDVVFHLKRITSDKAAYIYRSNAELRAAEITKTAPWEVTVKVPLASLITAIDRFGDSTQLVAPEIVEKYGGQINAQTSVGTGPYMLKDYIAGSSIVLERNPSYWMTDPIGPGKGNQLPYLDIVQSLIIPDLSTRLAALRTGKIDFLAGITWEDAGAMRQQAPELLEITSPGAGGQTVQMRTDMAPTNDIRVRRAILMATDFNAIHQAIAGGQGRFFTRPTTYAKGYETVHVAIDAPDLPESVKENFTYNPKRAKELLAEAGYPDGFKIHAMMTATQVDNYSIYKSMWDKVGIELIFDVKETGSFNTVMAKHEHPNMVSTSGNPYAIFHTQPSYTGTSNVNRNMLNDPWINETMEQVRVIAVTEGLDAAMKLTRQVTIRELELAPEVPGMGGLASRFWWPWIKNYAGETSVGYFNRYWTKFVWLDQDLKKEMGY